MKSRNKRILLKFSLLRNIESLFSILFFLSVFLIGILSGETAFSSENKTMYTGVITAVAQQDAHSAIRITETEPLAIRFEVSRPVSMVSVVCPSYGDNIGDLTFSLFRWKSNYSTTLTQQPIASKTFVDFADNETLAFHFAEQRKGSYLLLIHSPRQTVGVWAVAKNVPKIETFLGGKQLSQTPRFGYGFVSPFPFQGTLSEYKAIAAIKSTAPEEPKLAANDPILVNDVEPDTWTAIDDLNRRLPNRKEAGPVRAGKQVGIFYWTWHASLAKRNNGAGPFDNTKIMAKHPEALRDINHPAWGPIYHPHHWGEPLFGYYATEDKWVMRKHAEMLANAQIDVVIFDCTNGTLTWMDSTWPLLEAFAAARADGVKTPKIAFMLPFGDLKFNRTDLVQLYRDIYRPGKYQDLWFYWNGRPLIYAIPESLSLDAPDVKPEDRRELEEIRGFFTFRPGQPSYTGGPRRPDNWGWLEVYPQNGYVKKSDGTFEMVCVGASQNHSTKNLAGKSGLTAMNDINVFGRAKVVGAPKDTRPNAFLYGGNFQQQWSRAFELDPDFIFVTSWNEWIASRFPEWSGLKNAFPDEFDTEFSRDVEPARGILKDTFYMQLVANVRKFKGVRPLPKTSPAKTIDLNGSADQWRDVQPVFRDYRGDTGVRDAIGYGKIHYTNTTGRNDIISASVARDAANVYFLVETADKLSPRTDSRWMRLFLSFPTRSDSKSWENFQFVVNRTAPGEKITVERSTGGWNWEIIGDAEYRVEANRLVLAIPRKTLGLAPNDPVDFCFKWSDNMQEEGDILDFYQNGDAAPDGRFTWHYQE